MDYVEDIIGIMIPIFVCVVLPVSIIWIIMKTVRFKEARRTEVLIKAIESGKDIDANLIADAMAKPRKAPKTPRELLNLRLNVGSVFTIMGLFLLVITFVCFWNDDKGLFICGSIDAILMGIGLGFLITYFVTRKQVKD